MSALFVVNFGDFCHARSDIEPAKKIASLNKSSVQLISNYYCETMITVKDNTGILLRENSLYKSGQYWSTKISKRFRFENPDGTWFDGMLKDGELRGVRSSINKSKSLRIFDRKIDVGEIYLSGVIQKSQNIIAPGTDIDRRMLLVVDDLKPDDSTDPRDLYKITTFDMLFNENFRVFKSYTEHSNGNIVIEFSVKDKYKHEFWFNSKLNYMITKYRISPYIFSSETPLEKIIEVTDFKEATPGLFFPTKSTESFLINDKIQKIETLTLENLVVNESSIENQATVHFPPEIKVIDTIKGRVYKTTDLGKLQDVGEYKSIKPPNLNISKQGADQFGGQPSSNENNYKIYYYLFSVCFVPPIVWIFYKFLKSRFVQ